ncbi:MAG: hypothetical protein HRU75_01455 [Planctomycetia bacterium]|nr:MAG: hypothetical protein HRU75_01455 [Planctomycetia bacterium]
MIHKRPFVRLLASAVVISTSTVPPALAGLGSDPPYQINGSGATLFVDFSRFAAATNDWIDCDGDGLWGFYDSDGDTILDATDQLAPTNPGNPNLYWIYQYRSVGSVEGFEEFVVWQTCSQLPEVVPSERGTLNTLDWAVTGVPNNAASSAGWGGACTDDTDGDGIPNASNTPVCPTQIDIANVDVPSLWAVRADGAPAWFRKPGQSGYGDNSEVSAGNPSQVGESNKLPSLTGPCGTALNTNFSNPDNLTIYDTGIAWSTVAAIANIGTDLWLDLNNNGIREAGEVGAIRHSDLQHGYVTGRRKNGENLAFNCRDVGSGTRNAHMNGLGIDPSWGVGDHVGRRINQDTLTRPGPNHQVNNCGGSSISESAVQNRRICVGYTGTVGPSRAFEDSRSGRYELVGILRDIDGDNNGSVDGTQIVRPTLESIVNNCDPNTGFLIGGIQTLVTVGNPRAMNLGRVTAFESGPGVFNVEAAKFVRNIEESIAAFQPTLPPDAFFMPGDLLATQFVLVAATNCLPKPGNPTDFEFNNDLNVDAQNYLLANNVYRVGGANEPKQWGEVDGTTSRPAGLVPRRRAPLAGSYLDGGDATNAGYRYYDGTTIQIIGTADGQALSRRNRVAGDFNNDGFRNINDIERLVDAHHLWSGAGTLLTKLNTFEAIQSTATTDRGSMTVDRLVVHISGDFNGDGEYDAEDIRYFNDGLGIDPATGELSRKASFVRADQRWQTLTGSVSGLYGALSKSTGTAYKAGDARGDVAGSVNGPTRGAEPRGHDGVINCADVNYVCANFISDWSDTTAAATKDLSCDMDGDLDVDFDDVRELVEQILDTQIGDVNLDGVINSADAAIVTANLGNAGCYCDGDVNGDGVVNDDDLRIVLCGQTLVGDANCDGSVNNFDIDPFVAGILDPLSPTPPSGYAPSADCWNRRLCWGDVSGDALFNNFDIDPFVACIISSPLPGESCP